ncbi:MAG: hypothetical protein HY695_12735 [Deltaproteobacteria bacterium]|nr:hypothetical protein [Deltaproteobacteria bacterium]
MAKHPSFSEKATAVSIRLPKKLAGKKVILIDAEEYARLKRGLTEVEDALGKIVRGDAAHREGRTKAVKSLSQLGR